MVDLKQLSGQRAGRNGVQTIYHPMDIIRLDGSQVGLISRHNGAKCLFTVDHLTEDEKEAIRSEVVKLRAETDWPEVAEGTKAPPVIPPELLGEDDEEESEDADE